MATADYDPLYQPIRGKIQGTVMQTGRNAPVIKSIDNNKGSKLPKFQLSKARLQHAATLWRQLSPGDQASWNAARPNFPTVDRYGNPVLSSAYSLFLRAIAPLPNDRQVFLTSPGSVFTGTLPPDAEVTNIGGAITFKSMEAPVGQNFDAAVFCTRYNPVSKYFPKPSFRQVLRLDDYTGLQSIDITSFIEQNFGPAPTNYRVFWCVKTWKAGTPELVGYSCGHVDEPSPCVYTPGIYSEAQVENMIANLGYIPIASASDFAKISTGSLEDMGAGSCWAAQYTTGRNQKYIQVQPFDFSPLGTWTTHIDLQTGFVYDGNGFNTSNLTQTDGLFDRENNAASFEIRNFHLTNVSATFSTNTRACICNSSWLTPVFENCHVSGTVSMTLPSFTNLSLGAVLGHHFSASLCTITNCSFSGSMTGANGNSMGGVVGQIVGNGLVTGCYTHPGTTISATSATRGIVGGIVGLAQDTEFHNCTNLADVSGFIRVGGVCGHARNASEYRSCVNGGTVSGRDQGTGGINGSGQGDNRCSYFDCVNNGPVSVDLGGFTVYVGGITGTLLTSGDIVRCSNYADVSGPLNSNSQRYAGGIVGAMSGTGKISECIASGFTLQSFGRGGGIAGNANCSVIEDCFVDVDVVVQNCFYTGALAGNILGGSVTMDVRRCISVAPDNGGAGLIAIGFSGTATITECYWDVTVGPAASAYGTPQTTANLQAPTSNTGIYSTYSLSVWDFGTSSEYPRLLNAP